MPPSTWIAPSSHTGCMISGTAQDAATICPPRGRAAGPRGGAASSRRRAPGAAGCRRARAFPESPDVQTAVRPVKRLYVDMAIGTRACSSSLIGDVLSGSGGPLASTAAGPGQRRVARWGREVRAAHALLEELVVDTEKAGAGLPPKRGQDVVRLQPQERVANLGARVQAASLRCGRLTSFNFAYFLIFSPINLLAAISQ